MSDKITCDDVMKYEHLASRVPTFLLSRMAKRNSNLVGKFESQIKPRLATLSDERKRLLDIVLSSEVSDLQAVMGEAFERSGKKQFKILADPKNAGFIESNLDELRKLL